MNEPDDLITNVDPNDLPPPDSVGMFDNIPALFDPYGGVNHANQSDED